MQWDLGIDVVHLCSQLNTIDGLPTFGTWRPKTTHNPVLHIISSNCHLPDILPISGEKLSSTIVGNPYFGRRLRLHYSENRKKVLISTES